MFCALLWRVFAVRIFFIFLLTELDASNILFFVFNL